MSVWVRPSGPVRLGSSVSSPRIGARFLKFPKIFEFSEMKMEKRELEANLTSIRIELSENEHLKLDAETKRDDLAKVGFLNDIVISFW